MAIMMQEQQQVQDIAEQARQSCYSIKRILVPLDGSPGTEDALPIAVRIAHIFGASLVLVRVFPAEAPFARSGAFPHTVVPQDERHDWLERQKVQRYFQRLLASELLEGIGVQTGALMACQPETLVTYAQEQHIDLIILCSASYNGLQSGASGSFTRQLIRQSAIPLLLLQRGAIPTAFQQQPAEASLRVLVPLDGSLLAESVLLPTGWLSFLLSAPYPVQLHLIRIIRSTASSEGGEAEQQKLLEQECAQAQSYLLRMKSLIKNSTMCPQPLDVTTAVVLDTEMVPAVVRIAERGAQIQQASVPVCKYDLVALAAHHRPGLAHWGVGDVAECLHGGISVPLLIVAHPQACEPLTYKHVTAKKGGVYV